MHHPSLNIALKAARRASTILLQYYERRRDLVVHEKHPNDFVTEADRSSEQCLVEIIAEHFPEDAFLTEESGSLGPKEAERVWIIDPLDGTSNFIRGYPNFAISIALAERGRVEHGLVYHPLMDSCYLASRGHGARHNDRRIRVGNCLKLKNAVMAVGLSKLSPSLPTDEKVLISLFENTAAFRRIGSCALELCYVAEGATDGYWCNYTRPWDIAAGQLIVQEAGGVIADAAGGALLEDEGGILACNPKLLKSVLQCIHQRV